MAILRIEVFCYLEQQLVFSDSLNWFNQEVTNSQSGLDVLLDSLKDGSVLLNDLLPFHATARAEFQAFVECGRTTQRSTHIKVSVVFCYDEL